jgi:hypothetical protein
MARAWGTAVVPRRSCSPPGAVGRAATATGHESADHRNRIEAGIRTVATRARGRTERRGLRRSRRPEDLRRHGSGTVNEPGQGLYRTTDGGGHWSRR